MCAAFHHTRQAGASQERRPVGQCNRGPRKRRTQRILPRLGQQKCCACWVAESKASAGERAEVHGRSQRCNGTSPRCTKRKSYDPPFCLFVQPTWQLARTCQRLQLCISSEMTASTNDEWLRERSLTGVCSSLVRDRSSEPDPGSRDTLTTLPERHQLN